MPMPAENSLNWIEIDRTRILANVKFLSSLLGKKTRLAAAVKANGYGHGLAEMVAILSGSPVDYLALHSLDEAETARAAGWSKKIIIVGPIAPEQAEAVLRLDLEPTVTEPKFVRALQRLCRKSDMRAKIHIKLETGTHRQGMEGKALATLLSLLKNSPELTVEGASMHFANIEDTTDHTYALGQLARFREQVRSLRKEGIKPRSLHTACSAALLLFENTHYDMVRPGISLYGYWPSKETYVSYRLLGGRNNALQTALSFKARITQIKDVPAGRFIGYGCTYRTTTRSRIGIIPIGYADGVDRRLSNLGYVLVKGRRAPIRGRVCMNLVMIDITNIPGVNTYDTATLIGTDGEETITAATWADWCGTIHYEILARLSPLVPRRIV
jgi:alanine racemase